MVGAVLGGCNHKINTVKWDSFEIDGCIFKRGGAGDGPDTTTVLATRCHRAHTRARATERDGRPWRVQFVTHPAKVTAGFLTAGSTSNRSSFPLT